MGTTWKNIRKGMSEGIKNLSDKTGEMTKIGRLKIEIIALKRDIEKAFIELGGRVYHQLEEKRESEILSDQSIKKLVKDIKSFEAKLKTLEDKIQRVREHRIEKED
jgi:LPS O-antigen subunit length determinant protein (WzzB/FepE family)